MAHISTIAKLMRISESLYYKMIKDNEDKDVNLFKFLDENLLSGILKKYIHKSYLSHWKTAIEEIVLENRKTNFKRLVPFKEKEGLDVDFQKASYAHLVNTLYKIVIIFKPIETPGVVVSDKLDMLDIIAVKDSLEDIEQRLVVGHELGHIVINRLLRENHNFKVEWSWEEKEELATLLMYYILQDKTEFYQKSAPTYIKTPAEYKDIYCEIISTFGEIKRRASN